MTRAWRRARGGGGAAFVAGRLRPRRCATGSCTRGSSPSASPPTSRACTPRGAPRTRRGHRHGRPAHGGRSARSRSTGGSCAPRWSDGMTRRMLRFARRPPRRRGEHEEKGPSHVDGWRQVSGASTSLPRGDEHRARRGVRATASATYAGQWLVVFYWPMDFTFVCPTEIAEFGRHDGEFRARGDAGARRQHRHALRAPRLEPRPSGRCATCPSRCSPTTRARWRRRWASSTREAGWRCARRSSSTRTASFAG